jgi:hypothetical protein
MKMPSENIANEIKANLALYEAPEDAEYLFDALLGLRADLDISTKDNSEIVRRLLCFLTPWKPSSYIEAMQNFRTSFAGVATGAELQQKFRASVLQAALTLTETDPRKIPWNMDLYFSLEAAAGAGEQALER